MNDVRARIELLRGDITQCEVDAIVNAADDQLAAPQTPHAPSQRTPLLLGAVQDGTAGRALDANIVLLAANASLAARVAVALSSH